MLEYIKTLLGGFAIGVANVIPGVSGGTFALILGIYDKFIGVFDDLSKWVTTLIRFIFGFKKEKWIKHREVTKSINWLWIVVLFAGILLAVVLTSGTITSVLKNYPAQTYGVFFGLILASVVVPWSKMEKKGIPEFVAMIIAFFALFLLTGYEPKINYIDVDNVKMVESSNAHNTIQWDKLKDSNKKNYAYYVFRSEKDSGDLKDYIKISITKKLSYTDDEITKDLKYNYMVKAVESDPAFWFIIVASAISAAAMILPGLSGSFLLLLMGVYSHMLGSFSTLFSDPFTSIPVLMMYAIGIVIGLLSFAKVLKFLLNEYHSITMGFLIGLMLGSLRLIYPFLDRYNVVEGTEADEIPKLLFWNMPANVSLSEYLKSGEFISIVICFVIGFLVVSLLQIISTRMDNKG